MPNKVTQTPDYSLAELDGYYRYGHPDITNLLQTQKQQFQGGILNPLEKFNDSTPVNDIQIGGNHYKKNPVQPWDYIAANELDYFQGNIVKYVTRWKIKGGKEDLLKAKHYLDKYLETIPDGA